MFEDLIEALFNVDVDVRPSVKPEMTSFEFKDIVGLPIQTNQVVTQIEVQEVE